MDILVQGRRLVSRKIRWLRPKAEYEGLAHKVSLIKLPGKTSKEN